MPDIISTEGTVEFTAPFRGQPETHRTWYRVVRPADPAGRARPPLLVLHGGPGCTHDYLLSLTDLAGGPGGRPVIFYDQVGNGNSTHLPERGSDFWAMPLFAAELGNLVGRLGLAEAGFHLLGQSWGGFLAQEYALTRPAGLRSLVLADTASSWPGFLAECNKLRARLPPEVDAVLRRHEERGTFDDPEYKQATEVFYQRHVCRLDPPPAEVARTFALLEADPTVYRTMNGPSEFHCIGSAVGWDVTDRLPEIEVPALIVSGRHDEAGLPLQEILLNGLRSAELTVFGESSHMPHWEERERYMTVVGSWLHDRDRHRLTDTRVGEREPGPGPAAATATTIRPSVSDCRLRSSL